MHSPEVPTRINVGGRIRLIAPYYQATQKHHHSDGQSRHGAETTRVLCFIGSLTIGCPRLDVDVFQLSVRSKHSSTFIPTSEAISRTFRQKPCFRLQTTHNHFLKDEIHLFLDWFYLPPYFGSAKRLFCAFLTFFLNGALRSFSMVRDRPLWS